MISASINHILHNYNIENKKIFKKNPLAKFIRNNLVNQFQNHTTLKVKGSCGQGQWATIPWLGIFDDRMTESAQKGIYVVLLFKEDMRGVYLSLNQGVTYYNEVIKSNKIGINKMAIKFVRDNLYPINGFVKGPIKIYNSKVNHLNYEDTNIISKYYSIDSIDEKVIISDIKNITNVYKTFIDGLVNKNYEDFLRDISSGNLSTISTIDAFDQAVFKELQKLHDVDESQFIIIENASPHFSSPSKIKINSRVMKKVDYLSEHKDNMDLGLIAEKLVIQYEIERLQKLGIKEPEKKVKWISKDIGDGIGYDIQSVDKMAGSEVDRYIEVKGTRGNINTPFFLSRNELEFSKSNSNSYFLYRLYNIKKNKADLYILEGNMNQKLDLVPTTYISYVR